MINTFSVVTLYNPGQGFYEIIIIKQTFDQVSV